MDNKKITHLTFSAFKVSKEPVEWIPLTHFDVPHAQALMLEKANLSEELNKTYNESFFIKLTGKIDEDVLKSAIKALSIMHPIILSRYSDDSTQLLLDFEADNLFEKVEFDQNDDQNDAYNQLLASARPYASQGFNLRTGPLVKIILFILSEEHSGILLSVHSTICDGWSLDVLLDDLSSLYTGLLGMGVLPHPSVPGFNDFLEKTETPAYIEKKAVDLRYWHDLLGKADLWSGVLEGGNEVQSRAFSSISNKYALGDEVVELVSAFAKRQNLSMFTILFSAFASMLARKAQATEFVVCIPVARHPVLDMEHSVGCFVNFIPVICRVDSDTTFLNICGGLHEKLISGREHSSVDIEEIIQALKLDDKSVKMARFVPINKYSEEQIQFGPLEVDYQAVPNAADQFELSLSMLYTEDTLEFYSHARDKKYSVEWIHDFIKELERFLVNACINSGSTVFDVSSTEFPSGTSNFLTLFDEDTPKNDVEVKLSEIISKRLGLPFVGIHQDFFRLGGTPDVAKYVVNDINEVFDIELDYESFSRLKSIANLGPFAQKGISNIRNIVVPLNNTMAKPPLYFVCGIALYSALAKNLDGKYACFGIYVSEEEEFFQTQNDDNHMTIPELATLYIRAIHKHSPDGPYSLAGVSFGAILAFEIARQLKEAGHEVPNLVLLDPLLPSAISRNYRRLPMAIFNKVKRVNSTLKSRLEKSLKKADDAISDRERKNMQLWRAVRGKAVRGYFDSKPTYAAPALVVKAANRVGFENHHLAYDLGWTDKLVGPVIFADAVGTHLGILQSKETAGLIYQFCRSQDNEVLIPSNDNYTN